METDKLKRDVIREIDRIAPVLKKINKNIFNHPETAFNEFYAQKILTDYLKKNGMNIKKGIGSIKTSFKASLNSIKERPVIAFLAEYDALPGLGHACGHNIVCTASVGAAAALSKFSDRVRGNTVVIGTPAEEGGGGKAILVKKGILKGIDAAMMIHPSNKNKVVRRMLAVCELNFMFSGKAAHASAYPDRGINALDAVILTFNSINALRQQIRDDARVHGIVTEGGTAPNIIPDKASTKFYVRAAQMKYFYELIEKVKRCAQGAASATGTTLNVETPGFVYKPFMPNYTLANIFSKNLSILNIKEDDISETEGMGSSDIGNVSHEVPTIHADISVCAKRIACHTPAFAKASISEKGMRGILTGAKALALTAIDIMSSSKNMIDIKNEFARSSQNL